MLVLKDIPGGSLKITPDNSNNLASQKIASKESLGRERKLNTNHFPKNLFGLILTSKGYFKISGSLK